MSSEKIKQKIKAALKERSALSLASLRTRPLEDESFLDIDAFSKYLWELSCQSEGRLSKLLKKHTDVTGDELTVWGNEAFAELFPNEKKKQAG